MDVAPTSGELGVAYVLRRYPTLSETFVHEELLAVARAGVYVMAFSLLPGDHSDECNDRLTDLFTTVEAGRASTRLAVFFRALFVMPRRFWFIVRYAVKVGMADPRAAAQIVYWIPEIVSFTDLIRQRPISHIHTHFPGAQACCARIIASLAECSFSFTLHTVQDTKNPLFMANVCESDAVIAVSRRNLEAIREAAGNTARGKAVLIRQAYGMLLDRDAASGTDIDILVVARLVRKKGIDVLIGALGVLAKEGLLPRTTVVGGGPLRVALEHLAADTGIDNITFVGPMRHTDAVDLYRRSRLFVLPCRATEDSQDGLPASIVEAMSAGIPVISTAVGGIPEVLRDMVTGRLIEENNSVELAKAIEQLLSDDDLRGRLGDNAARLIRHVYNPVCSIRSLVRLYRRLAARGANVRR